MVKVSRAGSRESPAARGRGVAVLTAALALYGLTAGGCGSTAAPQDVTVRWLLVDGRSCLDAAVVSVTITTAGSSAAGSGVTGLCPAEARVDGMLVVPALTPGLQLEGRGISASDSVLYRGQLLLPDPVPPTLDLVLDWTGGQ